MLPTYHYVYEVINNINGKKYIGKRTCHCRIEEDTYMGSGKLIKCALKKYGIKSFSKKILYICNSEDQAYEIEKKTIEKVKAYKNTNYYNIQSGGRGGWSGINHSLEWKIKMSLANSSINNPFYGKHHSNEARKKMSLSRKGKLIAGENPNSRAVICLNNLKVFNSLSIAKDFVNAPVSSYITKCCQGEVNYCGFFNNEPAVWMYYDEYLKCSKEFINFKLNKAKKRKIICLNTLEIFDNMYTPSLIANVSESSISNCCRGKTSSCGSINGERGIFMYYDEYLKCDDKTLEKKKNVIAQISRGKRYVICLNNLKVFNSLASAANYIGVKSSSSIGKCCRKKISYCGYLNNEKAKWMYYDEYLETIGRDH